MHIVIMGAGGVGAYYGARLAAAGQEVSFVARGKHLEALQTEGLTVASHYGDMRLEQVRATADPAELKSAGLILFATKAFDLEAAAGSLKPILTPETVVIPLLNGVDIAQRVAAVLGEQAVLPGLVYVSCAIEAPGQIRQAGTLERFLFGEATGVASERGEGILSMLKGANIHAELSTNIEGEIWGKFLFIATAAGMCALTRHTLGPILADADTRAMLRDCLREIAAVGRARGVAIGEEAEEKTLAFMDGLPWETKPSLLLSLEQGKPLEVDALNGVIARWGQELGVSTPVNTFIAAALKFQAAGSPSA